MLKVHKSVLWAIFLLSLSCTSTEVRWLFVLMGTHIRTRHFAVGGRVYGAANWVILLRHSLLVPPHICNKVSLFWPIRVLAAIQMINILRSLPKTEKKSWSDSAFVTFFCGVIERDASFQRNFQVIWRSLNFFPNLLELNKTFRMK